MSRAIGLSCALLLGGCSLVWGVDPDRFRDGGMDASVDDGGADGGEGGLEDAGDAGDARVCPSRFERLCGDGLDDEDCDGLTDCNDFDCATELTCCGTSAPLFPVEDFAPFPSSWSWMPSSEGAIAQTRPGELHDFGNFGHPRAVRVDTCIPIDLGVAITATMRARPNPVVCPGGATDCENYASISITDSLDLIPPATLSSHLSVRVDHEGNAQIRAATGDVLIASTDDDVVFGVEDIQVTIELTPGIDESGPAVFATIRLVQGARTWPKPDAPAARQFIIRPVIPRQYLLGPAYGCNDARGLLLAFEGYGPNVSIDNVGVARYGCANPSNFEPVGAIGQSLDADDLDGTLAGQDSSDWTAGGLGSPSIQSFFEGEDERTELLYDASNRDRTLEGRDDVHYSIGGAWTDDLTALSGYAPRTVGGPMLGLRPPDCLGTAMPPGGCESLLSVREPSLFVPVDRNTRARAAGATMPLLFARETASSTGVFEIAGALAFIDAAMAPSVLATPLASPDVECVSMRDPVVVPTRPDRWTDLVVLYTCERAGSPSSIRALHLPEFPPASGAVTRLPGDVIDPTMLGAIAVGGVRAADAAVWFRDPPGTDDEEIVVRVWFISEDLSRDPATVSFAEGSGPIGALPTLHLYAANPVLRSGDPLLGTCPAAGCSIESVAVTRLANSPNTVRLMISRTPEPTTGIEHVLVPLDQVWPPLD